MKHLKLEPLNQHIIPVSQSLPLKLGRRKKTAVDRNSKTNKIKMALLQSKELI